MSTVKVTHERIATASPNGEEQKDLPIPPQPGTAVVPAVSQSGPQPAKPPEPTFYDGLIAGAFTFFLGGLFMALVVAIAMTAKK